MPLVPERNLRRKRFGALEEQEEWRSGESAVQCRRLDEGLHDLWSGDDPNGSDRYRLMSDAVGEPL
jgi:hypothetical protein